MLRTGAEVGDSELDVLSRLTDWLLDEGTSQWSESMERVNGAGWLHCVP